MPRAFISHASKDRRFIESEIVRVLNDHGVETWYSNDDIVSGEQWEQSIREGLTACDSFVLVMSPASAESDWVKAELGWAFKKMPDRIIPVLFRDIDAEEFHIRLAAIQHVDYRSNFRDAQRRLLKFWGISDADEFSTLIESGSADRISTWIWDHPNITQFLTSASRAPSRVRIRNIQLGSFVADVVGVIPMSIIVVVPCSFGSPSEEANIDQLKQDTNELAECLDWCMDNPGFVIDAIATASETQDQTRDAHSLLQFVKARDKPDVWAHWRWQFSGTYIWGRRVGQTDEVDEIRRQLANRPDSPITLISYDRVLDML